jgi:hypothetical protein
MQKQKFGVTCPTALFLETTQDPPEHEKWCIDLSCPGRTRMHYVTGGYQQTQKHKFGVTCVGALFVESEPVWPEHEK